MEESAFLKALAHDPLDDTSRLAFADWLEERGDPRAPWVRDPAIFRWMGPTADSPVPALVAALHSDDWERHSAAEKALASVGAPAVPALMEIVESGEGKLPERAGRALSQMS